MSLAISKTRSSIGIKAQSVSVEVHLSNGVPMFTIVGLPETAVKESRDRVRSAIINSQFEFPCRRITINLAPANLPKAGSGFDLPIAIGILAASQQIPMDKLVDHEFIGELALSGELRGVNAIIPVVLGAYQEQKKLIISLENAEEASLVGHPDVFTARSLLEVCYFLCQEGDLAPLPKRPDYLASEHDVDWSDIKGQDHAKKAMVIAAAGGHSILLSGPPGSGKTMLAKRFPTLLPPLSDSQALESASISSLRGRLPNYKQWRTPPIRSPHHTISSIALVGGGTPIKPGEISLAHHGVLFLDELPEFNRHVLETLREPLESGVIHISRAAMQVEYPAQFQLIAAMNPCPCGQWGNSRANCLCSPERISRYLAKLSAPLLDRIDMQINIQALDDADLLKPNDQPKNESGQLRTRIAQIQAIQFARQQCLNAQLSAKACEEVAGLNNEERYFLQNVMNKLKLSARAYHRLLKVARTIADHNEQQWVNTNALKLALSYKQVLQMPK